MKEQVIEALERSNFVGRYILLCNGYKDVDNGMTFKKGDLTHALNDFDNNLHYSSKEKLFYQDSLINGNSLRYVLPYKYGFIDCSYTIWNDSNDPRIRGSFAKFSQMVDAEFENKVEYKFPIATSLTDLEKILKQVIDLHTDFLKAFELSSIKV